MWPQRGMDPGGDLYWDKGVGCGGLDLDWALSAAGPEAAGSIEWSTRLRLPHARPRARRSRASPLHPARLLFAPTHLTLCKCGLRGPERASGLPVFPSYCDRLAPEQGAISLRRGAHNKVRRISQTILDFPCHTGILLSGRAW